MNLQSGTKSNDEVQFIQKKLESLTQKLFEEKYSLKYSNSRNFKIKKI